MKAGDVLPFVTRDWARVAEAKAAFWSERKRQLGAAEGVRISDELRRQVVAMRPGWPDPAARALDLEAHIALSDRMRRAFPPRRG